MVPTLPLEQITQDMEIQQRDGALKPPRVREYAKAMRDGDEFPPVMVFHDGDTYWLADGFHRCAAAASLGRTEIEADISEGSQRDALFYATGANAAHGIRRTNADKRRAVATLLNDSEWSSLSDHEIARQTHTTQPFVSKLRRKIGDGETMRKGADGRVIDTAKIGKKARLVTAWEKADVEARQHFIMIFWEEIEATRESLTSKSML